MRTITLGIVTTCISLLLVLEAVEAKSYFSPKSLAFQPRSRYCLVAQECPTPYLALEVLRGGASKKTTEEETDDETDEEEEDSDIEVSSRNDISNAV